MLLRYYPDCRYRCQTYRVVIFFFKQKTAYEMRISDWSSDVCSSDLPVSFKIMKILFIDAQNRTFTANYSEFFPEDSLMFPHKALFFARGAQKSADRKSVV